MNKIDIASKLIWDYMLMHHSLEKADVILVCGSSDIRVAQYSAKLYLDGWAPYIIFAGSGSIHNHKRERNIFIDTTEAEVFANIAIEMGVPRESIIIENESQNTGDNYSFALKKAKESNISFNKIISIHKPYMEKRSYAIAKVWLPNSKIIMSSPPISFENYPNDIQTKEKIINSLVGNTQRMIEYPKKGFQIEMPIPEEVIKAYEFLVSEGYTERLIN